jgi:hypothetical protein
MVSLNWPHRVSKSPCRACCWVRAYYSITFSISPIRDWNCLLISLRGSLTTIGWGGARHRGLVIPLFLLSAPRPRPLRPTEVSGVLSTACWFSCLLYPFITAPRGPGGCHWLGVGVSGISRVMGWDATLPFLGVNACVTPPPWGSGGSMVVFRGLEASLSWLTRKKDVFSDGCCFWCSFPRGSYLAGDIFLKKKATSQRTPLYMYKSTPTIIKLEAFIST